MGVVDDYFIVVAEDIALLRDVSSLGYTLSVSSINLASRRSSLL
jgi:hypothetical protein